MVVTGSYAAATYFLWYPAPLLSLQGGLGILGILLLVDAILGPMLTFVVFNPRKPRRELLTDLSLIAAVQIGAFAYGAVVIYAERPAYLAFAFSQFYVVRHGEASGAPPQALTNVQRFGRSGPRVVYATIPVEAVKDGSVLMASLFGDPTFALDATRYRVAPEDQEHFRAESFNASDLPRALRDELTTIARAREIEVADLATYHVTGRTRSGVAVVRRSSGEFLTIVDLDLRAPARGGPEK